MKYDPSEAEKYKSLVRAAKPDAMPMAFAIGRQGKDPVLFVARGKPNTAVKGLTKIKGTKLTNMGQVLYHDGQILLNCRKPPSLKIKTDFIEYHNKSGISPLTRDIILVAPGDWHDDVSGEEHLDGPVETDDGDEAESAETEAVETAPVADLADLIARQTKLADFLKGAVANIRTKPDLVPIFKDAAQKSSDAKAALTKEDAGGAEPLIVAAEALVQQLAAAAPPPPPGAPQPGAPSALPAYVQQQVKELIEAATAQLALLGEGAHPGRTPDFSVFERALGRHLKPGSDGQVKGLAEGKPEVDGDVAKLKLMIGRQESLEQLVGLRSAEDKVYSAATAKDWAETRKAARGSVDGLKAAIKKEFEAEAAKIEDGFKPLDGIFQQLDNKLSDELEKLPKITDAEKKKEQEKIARKLLNVYKGELNTHSGLLKDIDTNPWGIPTNLFPSLNRALDAIDRSLPN
jgi:hypothetical protein